MEEKHPFTTKIIEKSETAKKEEQILAFWKDEKIFEKSIQKEAPNGEFVFYEGPPTANGRPGIHHIEARSFKDAIPRYKTMRGYRVLRKAGWDTHGLPVELQVEKQLGLKSKKEVEEYGIAEFNKKCKESVWEYLKEWNALTERVGYWVDQKNPYVTYHNEYIESLWSVVDKIFNDGNIIRDYKIVPWCARCGTALSSHELAQGYEDVKDLSITAKFELVDEPGTFVLAWTTTPWTLPGNVALAVGEDIEYSKWEIISGDKKGESYIVAKDLQVSVLNNLGGDNLEKLAKVTFLKGSDLVGKKYKPVFSHLSEKMDEEKIENREKAFKIYPADFVTTTDGTGIVHTAVMYGQDDFDLGTKIGLPKIHIVKEDGHFIDQLGGLSGLFVKNEETDILIIKDLAARGLLFSKAKYEHSYPHCWRCKTPLIYYARDSWYITMSKMSADLLKENEKINWEPKNIKEGRFGEWLRNIKDWAISRERYWGTPIPIWQKTDGGYLSIGSINDLKKYIKKSGNTYVVIRHGEAHSNLSGLVNSVNNTTNTLTSLGEDQVLKSAQELKKEFGSFDLIFYSPLLRTKKTAEILADELEVSNDSFFEDERLTENKVGIFEGKKWSDLHKFFAEKDDWFFINPEQGESHLEIKQRVGSFLYELEKKYQGKKILIVTHGGLARMLGQVVSGAKVSGQKYTFKNEETLNTEEEFLQYNNAEWRKLDFIPLPHDDEYTLDLHRPYIDQVELIDDKGQKMERVKEVMDVWFDSGAMPFAQHHYPFENKDYVDGVGLPADFICEAIDQTRGWFYTLLAVGVLMDKGTPYKNVICLGHILDSKGKKMSKSLGNIVSPWDMIETYGADTIRFWMYSVNQPGESKNFDEKTLAELNRKVFRLLDNVYGFLKMYRSDSLNSKKINPINSPNILDKWILSKTQELVNSVTINLEKYDLLSPTREIRDFIADLSQWYLRRSRDRFKGKESVEQDQIFAESVLEEVLVTVSKLLAPFAPFFAEYLFTNLALDQKSVHLSSWPEIKDFDQQIVSEMDRVRSLISEALELRSRNNIKVRQPLNSLTINVDLKEEYWELIKEEVNVKEIIFGDSLKLDINITEDLKKEGLIREFTRNIQLIRKEMELLPSQIVSLNILENDLCSIIKEDKKWMLVSGVSSLTVVNEKDLAMREIMVEDISCFVRVFTEK